MQLFSGYYGLWRDHKSISWLKEVSIKMGRAYTAILTWWYLNLKLLVEFMGICVL